MVRAVRDWFGRVNGIKEPRPPGRGFLFYATRAVTGVR